MLRMVLCALVLAGAGPAFADTAYATMSVGVTVLPSDPPAAPAQPRPAGTKAPVPGH